MSRTVRMAGLVGSGGARDDGHRMGNAQTTAAEARAEAEARRGALRAERDATFVSLYGDRLPGRWVMAGS